MPKHDAYSWRMSRAHKSALEHIAREEGGTVAGILDRVMGQWVEERSGGGEDTARIRVAAQAFIGVVRGGDPTRAANARARVRTALIRRRAR